MVVRGLNVGCDSHSLFIAKLACPTSVLKHNVKCRRSNVLDEGMLKRFAMASALNRDSVFKSKFSNN